MTEKQRTYNGERIFSINLCYRKMDSHMQKNETRSCPMSYKRINSNSIKALNIRPVTVKFVEDIVYLSVVAISFKNQTNKQNPNETISN